MKTILKFFADFFRWIAFLVVTLVLLYLLYFLIVFLTGFVVNLKLIWLISLLSLIAFLFYWFNQLILLGIAFLVSYISPNKKNASIYFSLLIVSFGVFTLFEYWNLDITMEKKIVFEIFLVSIWGTLIINSIISYKASKIFNRFKEYGDYGDEPVLRKPKLKQEAAKKDPLELNYSAEKSLNELKNNIRNNDYSVTNMRQKTKLDDIDPVELLNKVRKKIEQEKQEKKVLTLKKNDGIVKYAIKYNNDGTFNIGDIFNRNINARKTAKELSNKYPNIIFNVIDQTDPNNQFAEGQYQIIATRKDKTP